MQPNLDYLKNQIKFIPPETLESHGVITHAKTKANGRPTYICPCGNGTGDTGDGLVVYQNSDGYAYHCNKKGCHYDNLSLLAIYYGLDCRLNFVEILNRAADDFGFCGVSDTGFEKYHSLKKIPAPTNKEKDFVPLAQDSNKIEKVDETELAAMIERDIAFSIEYLAASEYDKKNNMEVIQKYFPPEKYFLSESDRRGLSLETLKYFRCGFHPAWVHPKILLNNPQKIYPTRRIIIPISTRHYIAVALDSDRAKLPKKYWKMIAKTSDPSTFFGRQTITAKTEYIYIFEGEIDCLSAWQARQQKAFLKKSMEIFGVESATDLETGEIIPASHIKNCAYIATGGAASTSWIKSLYQGCRYYGIKPRIIFLFDDDDAGRFNAEKHRKQLNALGYPTITKLFSSKERNYLWQKSTQTLF